MSEIITVHLDQKPIYDIVIEKDFSQLGTAFSRLNVTGRKICIVTDSNVGPLYAKAVQEVLETTGNQIFVYTFAAGEESKNLNTVQDLYEFLIEIHFDRKDMLAALGGGVVGDLTGFYSGNLFTRHFIYPDSDFPSGSGRLQHRRQDRRGFPCL